MPTEENLTQERELLNQFVETEEGPAAIKIIGVGGAGCNAVKHMFLHGIKGVSYVVCNTDMQSLNDSPIRNKIHLGANSRKGLGAGNDPAKGEQAANESIDEITAMLQNNTEMVFITAGMGGGTGTGAAPVIARIAKEMGILTVGIITIPFLHDGEEKMARAFKGRDEMRKNVDALLVINNERLIDIYPDLDIFQGLSMADEVLKEAAKSIAEIITIHGIMNVDFADVDKMLRNGGEALMNVGRASGEQRIKTAINNALRSPLLTNTDIEGAKRVLINLYSNKEGGTPLKMEELRMVRDFMEKKVGIAKEVKVGLTADETLPDGEVKVAVIVTGFKNSCRPDAANRNDYQRQESIFDKYEFDKYEYNDDYEYNNYREEIQVVYGTTENFKQKIEDEYWAMLQNLHAPETFDKLKKETAYERKKNFFEAPKVFTPRPNNVEP